MLSSSDAPLAGITVVAFEQAVAAPFATRQLADLGARVIKVERPDGGDFARHYDASLHGLSSYFAWLNRGKESLTLDLKASSAPAVLERLLAGCDVVVQNLAPGAAERLSLDARSLRGRRPDLIVCTVSGYGSGGPLSERKAYDLLMQFETGLVSITGSPAQPAKVPISVADMAAGMYAFSGVLSALFTRERTGRADTVEVSMLECLAEWLSQPALAVQGGARVARHGEFHATIAPYGPYQAADGRAVVLAVQNEREWERFCSRVLDDPQLAADDRFAGNPRRVANRGDLDGLIRHRMSSMTSAELAARLDAAGIANGPVNSVQEFLDHPQLRARKRWSWVDSQFGPFRALVPPLCGDDFAGGAVPALGEHTDRIMAELGLGEDVE